jgi:large subunit ribosomal protein L29
MKASELRAKDAAGLEKEVSDLLKAHFGLRMQKATQQLTNHSQLGKTRRDIARAKTIQTEAKRGAAQARRGEEDRAKKRRRDPGRRCRRRRAGEPRANTRTLIGKVVSDKRSKTITVLIERRTKHELYGKIVAKSSKYHAHDENDEYKTATSSKSPEPADLEDQVVGRDALVQKGITV